MKAGHVRLTALIQRGVTEGCVTTGQFTEQQLGLRPGSPKIGGR